MKHIKLFEEFSATFEAQNELDVQKYATNAARAISRSTDRPVDTFSEIVPKGKGFDLEKRLIHANRDDQDTQFYISVFMHGYRDVSKQKWPKFVIVLKADSADPDNFVVDSIYDENAKPVKDASIGTNIRGTSSVKPTLEQIYKGLRER